MSVRIALVTGANRGIGFETALGLARLGHHVLLGARHEGKGEAAAARLREEGLLATALRLNMDDAVSHADAAAHIDEAFGRLDVLVNNAATIHDRDTRPSEVIPDAIRKTFETNFTMLVALTQRMLPLLRRSDGARIVNLSSARASLALNAEPEGPFADARALAYSASKAAVNMFTVELAQELRPLGIKVNSADPGWVPHRDGGRGGSARARPGGRGEHPPRDAPR